MDKKELQKLVKKEFLSIPLGDLLEKSPSVLADVSEKQANTLKHLKINNLYDLGLSDIFQNARYITSINNKDLKAKAGLLPDDMVDEKNLLGTLTELKFREPAILTGIGNAIAGLLKSDFGFKKIEDLAKWQPYYAARIIVNEHLGINTASTSSTTKNEPATVPAQPAIITSKAAPADPEAPQELVPKMGEYPVEVVYYDTVVMTDAPKRRAVLQPLSGRVSLNYDDRSMGYDEPGFGAILTFKQSWFAQGITLGSLIKSIALAPGESTKIAVIDWQRKTTGTTAEIVTQKEELENSQTQKRAIAEVAGATASEIQAGTSMTGSISTSSNIAIAGGGMVGPVLTGGTVSGSLNTTAASSVSATAGQRDISSSMQQNINNSTQQNSFSSRNKRSSIVSEVSQSESETITTRCITNYNHMHALTIQYWQVVQSFTTELQIDRYKRCIFVPMDIINFNDERVINKFKSVLYSTARSQYIKDLIFTTNSFVNVEQVSKHIYEGIELPPAADDKASKLLRLKAIQNRINDQNSRKGAFLSFSVNTGLVTDFQPNLVTADHHENSKWKMSSNSSLVNVDGMGGIGDEMIEKINIVKEDGSIIAITKNNIGTNYNKNGINPAIQEPIALSSVASINVECKKSHTQFGATINFNFNVSGNFYAFMPIDFLIPPDTSKIELLKFKTTVKTNELGVLLNEDALYYSQQIWMNMDPNFLSMQLSPYKVTVGAGSSTKREVSLTEYIDPKPIAVMGNCLAFIFHDNEDTKWIKWQEDNIDKEEISRQKVALPTDGIFGEAVLGRFNSAEKLDMTRFWNWQDSPIPFAAPEIAAIQAGQHQVDGAPTTGNLNPSVLSIQAPQALPDPTGMQGVMQAITAANLFRDMSGIAQTSALAQSALNASSTSAIAAGNQAGANMATFANFQVEMAKIAASLAPMLLGLPPLPTPATNTISGGGAALNAAKSLDTQQSSKSADPGISPESFLRTTAPNQQKVLDKITGTTSSPAPISLPSPTSGAPSNERDRVVTAVPESKQIDDILNNAAASPAGALSTSDEQKIVQLMKDDYNKNIKPAIPAAASDFEKLRPELKKLLDWMAKAEATGIDDALENERNEGLALAKQAMFTSLNNAIDRAKQNNDIKQVRLSFDIAGNAQLLGFDGANDGFSPDIIQSNLNLSLIINTNFDAGITNGQERLLKINVLLKIDNNSGTPIDGIAVGVSVTGGTALPFGTGLTNEFGNFNCNIQCTDRSIFAIEGQADGGLPELLKNFTIAL